MELHILVKLFFPFLCVALISGCAMHRSPEIDPNTGEFSSLSDIKEDEITVYKPYPGIKKMPFVYLRTVSSDRTGDFESSTHESFDKIGFPKTLSEYELAKLVINRGLSGEVRELRSLLSLHRLSQAIGPFLAAEFRISRSGFVVQYDATIIDAASAETLFQVSRRSVNWIDFDTEFSNPVMNAVKRWFEESAALPVPETVSPGPRIGT